jgi:SNF2 family DNA or RNA helicase
VVTRNPTLEEQALARIHRLGQEREVTTVRFVVKDTFEEVGIALALKGNLKPTNICVESYADSAV